MNNATAIPKPLTAILANRFVDRSWALPIVVLNHEDTYQDTYTDKSQNTHFEF